MKRKDGRRKEVLPKGAIKRGAEYLVPVPAPASAPSGVYLRHNLVRYHGPDLIPVQRVTFLPWETEIVFSVGDGQVCITSDGNQLRVTGTGGCLAVRPDTGNGFHIFDATFEQNNQGDDL